ncbi:hypothetical protein D9M69_582180 [compost metagenome]
MSLVGAMVMPRLPFAFSCEISRKVCPPACAAMDLPRKDSRLLGSTPPSLRATSTTCATNVVGANDTSLWRSRLLVVLPHSRSMVPLANSGMRVADVVGL